MSDSVVNRLLDLTDRVAIVTGGARGIGESVALLLAHAGADVAVADLNLEGMNKVAAEIEALGRKALAIQADVTRAADVERMVQATVERFGGVDIVVNNAGIIPPKPTALDVEEEDWERVHDTNVKGVFLCSRAVAREMVRQGRGGKIVNIASFEGVKPFIGGMIHYEASKAAVIMFTRSLARALAEHRINVNAVGPGVIDTPGVRGPVESLGLDPVAVFGPRIPWGRLGQPEDVARAVLFLASDAAEYITGVCLFIDGGILLA